MNRLAALMFSLFASGAFADNTQTALAHPPFDAFYACTEHFAGQLSELGDALGTDCEVQKFVEGDGRMWLQSYATNGQRNEDWFGWNEEVLSPCDCVIANLHNNPEENQPGITGTPPASFIELRRKDGVHFMLAHVRLVSVRQGDHVKAGQPVAKVGNNGYARNPHVHIGAWKNKTPLQLQFDQTKMKLPPEFRTGEAQQRAPGDGPRAARSARP